MTNEGYPKWVSMLDDATGFIVIIVALAAILESSFSYIFALEILSFGLLVTGIAWIVWGMYLIRANRNARIFILLSGTIITALALVDFVFYSLPPEFLILFPAFGLVLIGISRIVLGIILGDVPLWIQMLQFLAGVLTLNLAAFVFIFTNAGFIPILALLVILLIANGLVRIIVGRTDTPKQLTRPTEDSVS
ncbi:MAG: hypothetical protein E4H14_05120 [Candidatus Thorarchaeota archaeon]|nr:MAG: hypothetical protein E4H14_05120 [Candidatus Thorarchaeota archaeon]